MALDPWSFGKVGLLFRKSPLACCWFGSGGWWHYLRPKRPISVSAVPFGPGIDIWRSCRFIGAMMRSLCMLPGGLGRFLSCSVGANHCRLRHIGILGGRSVVMVLLLDLVRVPFDILLSLGVLCLLALFLFGIVLLGLLTVPRLGGYRFLVMLLA